MPTLSPTFEGRVTFTSTASATPSNTVFVTPSDTATATPTDTALGTPIDTATATPTDTVTATPTDTPVPLATILVGSSGGQAGDETSIEVNFSTALNDVTETQNDIAFTPLVVIAALNGQPNCTVGSMDFTGAFAFLPAGCSGANCTGIHATVRALSNATPISSGSLLYTCMVSISPMAQPGTYALTCTNPLASGPNSPMVPTSCQDGAVSVAAAPTPTDTMTATPTETPEPLAFINVGEAPGMAGSETSFEVNFTTVVNVNGTQNDITFPSGAVIPALPNGQPNCTPNVLTDEGTAIFVFLPDGCSGASCTGIRATAVTLNNMVPIPSGSPLYSCQISIAASTPAGTYDLTCTNAHAAAPDGASVPTSCTNGAVTVF